MSRLLILPILEFKAPLNSLLIAGLRVRFPASGAGHHKRSNFDNYQGIGLAMEEKEVDTSNRVLAVNFESQSEMGISESQKTWTDVMDRPIYKTVAVLLLCWDDSFERSLALEEITSLGCLLSDSMNFYTQIECLSMAHKQKWQLQVNAKVSSFIFDHDGPMTLLIVYYAGHSVLENLRYD